MNTTAQDIEAQLATLQLLRQEIEKVVLGQAEVVDQLLISLLAGGHSLIEGVPGLAKTLMIRTLAQATSLKFKRIQFTPDLMPTDIIGTEILEEDATTGKRFFKFNQGPIFANIILADEINRTPPKTQAALLEAMQEFEVTYAGQTYRLDRPFLILATQNPIEQAGTFPLPEAQLDRFLLLIRIDYPDEQAELAILQATTGTQKVQVQPVLGGEAIVHLQQLVREVPISSELTQYVNQLIRATRPQTSTVAEVKNWVRWGAGLRAGQALILTAKARALLQGRYAVTLADVQAMAYPVLRHRVLVNFKAEAEGITTDAITAQLLQAVRRP
ncbi:MAG TPA: AAA family ATPase [Microscillaceae bacterium]|nr:AAA family ATPase [Microscillaceae bacterium]